MRTDLKSLTFAQLRDFVRGLGLPAYRAEQLRQWMYRRGAADFEEITVLSKDLRATLAGSARISSLALEDRARSEDGTEKFLWGLDDGEAVESVLIPEEDRLTLCISSQAGCAMACRFCFTATLGFTRNLRCAEIVNQIIGVNRLVHPDRISHVVFMGMGEPLGNLDEVLPAIERITSSEGLGISKRRVTVSTSGDVAGIDRLGRSAVDVNLAISLNATTNETRSTIMPVNRRYPLERLLDACRRFPLAPRRRITFEYVLIAGVNDSWDDARRLPRLLKGIRAKVNLIPLNSSPQDRFRPPSAEHVLEFQERLAQAGLTATLRKSRGADIAAACGQLRATHHGSEGGEA